MSNQKETPDESELLLRNQGPPLVESQSFYISEQLSEKCSFSARTRRSKPNVPELLHNSSNISETAPFHRVEEQTLSRTPINLSALSAGVCEEGQRVP